MAVSLGLNTAAQSAFTRQGNNFTQVSKKSPSGATEKGKRTAQTYTTTKNETYPIYLSKNGRAYILRTSQKTGKEYKQYLGEEISREVCKINGVAYVEKGDKK